MTQKNILSIIGAAIILAAAGFLLFWGKDAQPISAHNLDATPRSVTLSGNYECLPHMDTSGPQTMECAFGLRTDTGEYYAVDFGSSTDSMQQFQAGAYITAEGFVVPKMALSSSHWFKYNMEGVFTITRMINSSDTPAAQGKLNIDAVCEGALAYMTFPNGEAAAKFVAECKEGKHPEVIERYKADMNLGDGAMI